VTYAFSIGHDKVSFEAGRENDMKKPSHFEEKYMSGKELKRTSFTTDAGPGGFTPFFSYSYLTAAHPAHSRT
jgi:hypothetical protein